MKNNNIKTQKIGVGYLLKTMKNIKLETLYRFESFLKNLGFFKKHIQIIIVL